MTDVVLVGNLQNQLDRLMNQLSDLEEERPNMDAKEYEELKTETMEELQDLSRTLEKMTGGSITVIDNLTATRMAVRAAISQAFRTPEIVALFARKQPAALRQKLIVEMIRKKRSVPIDMPGLPKPWSAYMHLVKKRIFYHNSKTGESLWELPAGIREKCAVEQLGTKLDETFSAHAEVDDNLEEMDCTEWDDTSGNSPAENLAINSHLAHLNTSTSTAAEKESEDMDIDFSDDLRQLRGIYYDQNAVQSASSNADLFSSAGTSRCCVVFDTCALIDDPELISDCIGKLVPIVVPYRVFYELDNLKKNSSTLPSGEQLRLRAMRIVHKLRDLRSSPLVYWESSSEGRHNVQSTSSGAAMGVEILEFDGYD
ncbi:hypothetical protein GCK32_006905 [Trichostrongylus colubriformis]|uniref:WW domain-containing protein n=1 Tax=Trichostrongylus colubriformis TaxID=6319 RepID=A0AAN8FBK1_TRICO